MVAQDDQGGIAGKGVDTGQVGTGDTHPGPKKMLQEPWGESISFHLWESEKASQRKGHLQLCVEE